MSTSTVAELLKDKAQQSPHGRLFSVGPDVLVADAVALMVKSGISSVLILDKEEMLGLITLRELLQGLNAHGGALRQAK